MGGMENRSEFFFVISFFFFFGFFYRPKKTIPFSPENSFDSMRYKLQATRSIEI